MNTLAFLALALGSDPGGGARPLAAQSDLAAAARDALVARCADCHRPDGADPRARRRFDFAADLARVAESDYVIPFDPDLSELWLQIDVETMPPVDAPTGPMSPEERAAVRAWIAAGAPGTADGAAGNSAGVGGDEPVSAGAPPEGIEPDLGDGGADRLGTEAGSTEGPRPPSKSRILPLVGRFHPAAVHFPIAFVLGALVLEGLWVLRRKAGAVLRPSVLVLLRLAALTSPPAALLGWWNALDSAASDTLFLHRWLGVAGAAGTLVVWALAERAGDGSRGRLRLALVLVALVIGAAGHWGGVLVYGPDYLPWP